MEYIMMALMSVAVGCAGLIFAIVLDKQEVESRDNWKGLSALVNVLRRGKKGAGKQEEL